MLRRVVAAAMRPRRTAAAGLVVVAAVGFTALPAARERALPPVGPPVLQVRTATPNLSAEDVERLVTAPLEADLRANVTSLEALHSTSLAGLSVLDLKLRVGSIIDRDRQAVQDRLALARLPGIPLLVSPADRLLLIGVHSSLSTATITDLVNGRIRPALIGVPGVGDVWVWGESEPLLVVEQLPGVNIEAVTAQVQERLDELAPGSPQLQFDPPVYRAADYLTAARHELGRTLAWTAFSLLLALVLLLLDWRRAVLIALAAPIPVLVGLAALRAHHTAVDAMTVTGLAAVVPLTLFDAVVLSEVGARALRDRAGDPVGRLSTMLRRLGRASLLVAAALLPVLFLDGLPERPFLPRTAGIFALGLLATAGTALVVVPVVLGALPGRPARSPARRLLRVGHDRVLWPLARPAVAVVVLAGLLAAGAVACTQVTTRMRPAFHDPAVTVRLQAWPGTTPGQVSAARDRVLAHLGSLPGVRAAAALPDCADLPARDDGQRCADVALTLDDGTDRDRILAGVRSALVDSPGLFSNVQTDLDARLADATVRSHVDLVVRVSGDDRAALRARADEVREALGGVRGVLAPVVTGAPEVIEHRDTIGVLDVEAGISGRHHDAVRAEVRSTLAGLAPAAGTEVHLLDANRDRHRLIAAGIAVAVALLLLLAGVLGAGGALLVGAAGVPAVLGAGMVALWMDDAPLGPGGLAGLVVLGALLLRAALLLVPDLQRAGADTEARRIAAGGHAVPLLQACGVLAVVAVPWLMTGQRAGTEQLHPFAVVLVGGIPALALVSLLALPGLVGGAGRRGGQGQRSPGPVGEAETPMSVNRWIDQVNAARPSAADAIERTS
ncbi:MAG TPA: efflux RND transporter permease subunit [Sporichthyaceae bacterium]|nr:efflux RND transporter permease subunit [Sporichthyaceae bacterium]